MKRYSPLLFFLAACYLFYSCGAWFCNARTDAFTIERIHSALPYNKKWATPLPEGAKREALQAILDQPFHYLGFGGQCFAFVSADDQYVIKFFKHKIRKPWDTLYALPLPAVIDQIRTRKLNKILDKLDRDFTSYKLAYEQLPEETEILYVHLNKTTTLSQTITILDKLNIAHAIDLDQIEFIVQKKATLAYTYLNSLAEDHNLPQLQAAIDSLIEVVISRCHKGIFDEDAKIHRNFGFINGKAIVIDVGRFRIDPSRKERAVMHEDLKDITRGLRAWTAERCPELSPWLTKRVATAQ